jgi:type VII secretion protein EccB
MRPPATRDQADAYRFGVRRLEAALVRGDPVPRHEQIRGQRRATLAGVLLGLLGLCAVAGYAAVVPRPDWRAQVLLVGAGSGAMYVVAHRPDRLVPVPNLVAARLLLAALRSGDADPGRAVPVSVPDEVLAGAPRTPAAAVPGALDTVPEATVAARWAVCDEAGPDGRTVRTTVVGGAASTTPVPPGDGVLLVDQDGAGWLLVAGRRHRIDLADGRLMTAYGLDRAVPRAVSGAVLAVLPEGPALRTPTVPGRGDPAPRGVPGRVGDVLVARPAGAAPRFYVVLAGGVQQVSELVAELLRVASVTRAVRPVPLDVVASATAVDELPVAGWPAAAPRLWTVEQAALLCWTWAGDGPPAGGVWLGPALPVPAGTVPVALTQADGAGALVDAVAVGAGGAVRAVGTGGGAGSGAVWLISGSGVAYPVVGADTAAAIGITATEPAPAAVVPLLPTGPPLDVRAAGRVLDLPPAPG